MYSTSYGERKSRPFHEEPETFTSIIISTSTVLHDEFLCYALSIASTSMVQSRFAETLTITLISANREDTTSTPQPLVRSLQHVEVWPYLEERKKRMSLSSRVFDSRFAVSPWIAALSQSPFCHWSVQRYRVTRDSLLLYCLPHRKLTVTDDWDKKEHAPVGVFARGGLSRTANAVIGVAWS